MDLGRSASLLRRGALVKTMQETQMLKLVNSPARVNQREILHGSALCR